MPEIDVDKHYVLDQHRDVVVAGPLSEQAALREATERGIEDHIAITGSSLQQVADGRALAWETGEVRQVTDGGRVRGSHENDEFRVSAGVNTENTVELTVVGDPSHSMSLDREEAKRLHRALGAALETTGRGGGGED